MSQPEQDRGKKPIADISSGSVSVPIYESPAILHDINRVAWETGTSLAMIKKNYGSRGPISRTQAEEWFAL